MSFLRISKFETKTVEKTHKILQIINLIDAILSTLVWFFFVFAARNGTVVVLCFIAAFITVPIHILISLLIQVRFGMYYDIRVMAIKTVNTTVTPVIPAIDETESDELPEL